MDEFSKRVFDTMVERSKSSNKISGKILSFSKSRLNSISSMIEILAIIDFFKTRDPQNITPLRDYAFPLLKRCIIFVGRFFEKYLNSKFFQTNDFFQRLEISINLLG